MLKSLVIQKGESMKPLFVILLSVSLGSFSYLSSIDASEKNGVDESSASVDILANNKAYSVNELSGEIRIVEPSFYLQLRTEPFPENLITIKRRSHALPGNTYGREYKKRMNQERMGVVVYQCNIQEGVEDDCEAITELVSYAELMRKLRGVASKNARISLISGLLGAGTVAFNPILGLAGFAGLGAYLEGAETATHRMELTRDLLNQEIEVYSFSYEELVKIRKFLVKVTSSIVKNRR